MASISKQGKRYRVRVRREGQAPISKCFTLRKDAEAFARAVEVSIERDEYEATPKAAADPKQTTLGQLIERYRDEVSSKKKGKTEEFSRLNALAKHSLAKKTLHEIKPSDWVRYRDDRLKKVKPQSLHREFNIFKHMYEVANTEFGYTKLDNPILKVKLEYVDIKRERRLKAGEREAILAEAGRRRNKQMVPIIKWAIETGMRRSEILALRWSHIDLKARELIIPDSKSGQSRTLPITRDMMAILEGQDIDTDTVFPIKRDNLSNTWDRILGAVGLSDLHFHDLRREAISTLFEKGLAIQEVASISGHADWKMLKRYTAPRPADILRKLELVTT